MILSRFYTLVLFVRYFRRYKTSAEKHKIVKKYSLNHFHTEDWCRSELRARDLLCRAEKSAPWVSMPLYPAGGAAGPLLLYLLIRILTEMPVKNVLELGAGQSTRMIDAWAQSSNGRLCTFEQDKLWADSVRLHTNPSSTQVLHLPLIETVTQRGKVEWYADPPVGVLPDAGFDLILVDGPVGSSSLSRYGVVEKIPLLMATEWIVVWDDLDRSSDLESFALLIDKLRKIGVSCNHLLLDGDRTVGIVYTPKFNAARYLW